MKKIFTLFLIIFIGILAGSLYGIVHDEFTYTISPEYYTKYKFPMFGLDYDTSMHDVRLLVAATGVNATWWVGFFIGLVLGLMSLIHKDWKVMLGTSLKAMQLVLTIALAIGLIGLGIGWLTRGNAASAAPAWDGINILADPEAFHMVGTMHNFSYIGGAVGLIVGVVYIIRKKRKLMIVETEEEIPVQDYET